MASTNKTTHYELSQYIGTDKPTYLTDYNQDMDKIDAGIYGAKSLADINNTAIGTLSNLTTTDKTSIVGAVNEVNGKADGIGTLSSLTTTDKTSLVGAVNEVNEKTNDIGTLANLTTTDKTSLVGAVNEVNSNLGTLANLTTTNKSSTVGAINEVNTNLGTLSSLTTADKTSAVGAINEVKNIIENFNLSVFDTFSYTDMTTTTGTLSNRSTITVARNTDGSLAKIYGIILITGVVATGSASVTISTDLRPSSEINITGNLLAYSSNNLYTGTITLKTNGDVVFTGNVEQNVTNKFIAINSLLFVKDFGDVPTPQI